MRTRFFLYPFLCVVLAGSIAFAAKPTPAPKAAATATPAATISKPVVDQTAQTIIYCYHRLVDKVRYPGTEITPAVFEAQMKELKDRGITVISLQDLLAWKRGEKKETDRRRVRTMGPKRSRRLQATARTTARYQDQLLRGAVWHLQRARERNRAQRRLRSNVHRLRTTNYLHFADGCARPLCDRS